MITEEQQYIFSLEEEVNRLTKENRSLKQIEKNTSICFDAVVTQRGKLEDKNTELNIENSDLLKKNEKLTKENINLDTDNMILQSKNNDLEESVDNLLENSLDKDIEIEKLKKEFSQTKVKLQNLQTKYQFEKMAESLSNFSSTVNEMFSKKELHTIVKDLATELNDYAKKNPDKFDKFNVKLNDSNNDIEINFKKQISSVSGIGGFVCTLSANGDLKVSDDLTYDRTLIGLLQKYSSKLEKAVHKLKNN